MTIYSVGQLNTYVANMFRSDLPLQNVCVRGEISNCKYHTSGHIYFTLKDADSQLPCVMFNGFARNLDFRFKDGMEVEVLGSVEVYVPYGKYQLMARSAKRGDVGDLAKRFEELKKRLEEEGLFDPAVKQPIPKDVKKVGIVTAPTGAAVRDIISVSKRRNPYIELILYPAQVQGEGAKESIVKGILALEKYGVDVIIVGRGGGSMEDLWAFNEEVVAQAIFNCPIPVISAVGHETDFTIADFVADVRAATPSVAAEIAVSEIAVKLKMISDYSEKLQSLMKQQIRLKRAQITRYEGIEKRMNSLLVMRKMRSEQYSKRLSNLSPARIISGKRMECLRLEEKLSDSMDKILKDRKTELALCIERFKRVSIFDRLQGGLGYISDPDGKRLISVTQFSEGQDFVLRIKDGTVYAKTLKTEAKNDVI